MTGDSLLLIKAVFARKRIAVFQTADQHIFDAAARGALVPVVKVGDVDVIAFVVAPPGPQRAAIKTRQVRPLRVQLRHAHRTVLPLKGELVVVLVVKRGHAVDAEHRAVIQGQDVLAKFQLRVLLALVAQPVFGFSAGQFETRLFAPVE